MTDDLKRIWEKVDASMGPQRMETEAEHIARDIREGNFPKRSDPIQVPVNPPPEMTDIMPKDEVKKLLDKIAEIKADLEDFDGDTRGHKAALWNAQEELEDRAPNLARSLIAAHDEIERLRADAQAAVALALNGAADEIKLRRHLLANVQNVVIPKPEELAIYDICEEAVRDLAPTDGLALVAELRAERDAAVELSEERLRGQHRLSNQLNDTARELNADNARLAAQVEALTGAVKTARECFKGVLGAETADTERRDQGLDLIDAALDAAALAAMTPAERADYDLTMRIRGAAGGIAKAQIAERDKGEAS